MKPLVPPLHAGSRILLVDDEPANVALLHMILEPAGYHHLCDTLDPRRVLALVREFQPDLILLDLMMPHLTGFELLEQLAAEIPPEDFVPVLVLTADAVSSSRHRALAAGASDFVTKPFDQVEVLLRIHNLLRMRAQHLEIQAQKSTLEGTVQARTRELRETLDQLRNTQQQVISQERLSALGSMTAGIAHDFNNALSLILGYGELLREDVETLPGAAATEHLGVVLTAARDAVKMFQRLRDFQRPAYPGQLVGGLDLNSLVAQAVQLTRPRWHSQAQAAGADVRVEVQAGKLPPLTGDPGGLRDVLTNLIFNAVDALPGGGVITLRTSALPGGGTRLEVTDDGVGMDEATRCRCLEPFFTTKRDGGTGLGLAMVYGAVNRHGGNLDIRSAPGAGTTFRIDLPPAADEAATGIANIPNRERPLRILVVDDQPVYRELLRQALVAGWHQVETAASGRAALTRLATRAFDVVITDFTMSGMNGDRLAARIKRLAPRTRVILLTGSEAGRRIVAGLVAACPAVDLVLAKPVLNGALFHALTQVMDTLPPSDREDADDVEKEILELFQAAS